jgi:hypothetical protein
MSKLRAQLESVRQQHQHAVRMRRVWRALWVWAAVVWAVVTIDAAWSIVGGHMADDAFAIVELPVMVRVALGLVIVVGAAVVTAQGRLPRRVRQRGGADYARWCERRCGMANNVLTNAVELQRDEAEQHTGLARELARRAEAQGDEAAKLIDAAELIDTAPVKRERRRAMVVAAVWGVSLLIGALMSLGWPGNVARLIDPLGDHPPAALHRIVPGTDDPIIAVGDAVTVRAAVYPGGPAMRVRTDDGRSVMMQRVGRSAYEAPLGEVHERVRYVVEGGHGRSRVQVIDPVPLPRVLAVSLAVRSTDGQREVTWPADQEVVVPVGSTVRLTVQCDRADTRLVTTDEAPASTIRGLTAQFTVAKGERTAQLHVVAADGLQSRDAITLRMRGLTPAEVTGLLQDTQQQATGTAALDGGTPTDPSAGRDGTPKPNDTTAADAQGVGGGDGEGEGESGQRLIEQLVRGLTSEQATSTGQRRPDVQRFADAAPRAYREMVARYFLRLYPDDREERGPSDE